MNRVRNLLQIPIRIAATGALFTLSILTCISFAASSPDIVNTPHVEREHRLRFYHTHTNERLDVVYRKGDRYIPEAISQIEQFLRDHRTGDVHHYDPRVLDLLWDLTAETGHPDAEIDVICGYRTPWSNEYLRHHSLGVAKKSLHMQAMAIDIRIPGVKASELRAAALRLRRGGVGYYPVSDFVHVDVGRVRQW